MHWWALAGLILTLVAFMADLGMVDFPKKPVFPSLAGGTPTVFTMILFLIVFGILGRMFTLERKKRKELMQEEIEKLEERVAELEKEKPEA